MINESIKKLGNYGLDTGLVLPEDKIYVTNRTGVEIEIFL